MLPDLEKRLGEAAPLGAIQPAVSAASKLRTPWPMPPAAGERALLRIAEPALRTPTCAAQCRSAGLVPIGNPTWSSHIESNDSRIGSGRGTRWVRSHGFGVVAVFVIQCPVDRPHPDVWPYGSSILRGWLAGCDWFECSAENAD